MFSVQVQMIAVRLNTSAQEHDLLPELQLALFNAANVLMYKAIITCADPALYHALSSSFELHQQAMSVAAAATAARQLSASYSSLVCNSIAGLATAGDVNMSQLAAASVSDQHMECLLGMGCISNRHMLMAVLQWYIWISTLTSRGVGHDLQMCQANHVSAEDENIGTAMPSVLGVIPLKDLLMLLAQSEGALRVLLLHGLDLLLQQMVSHVAQHQGHLSSSNSSCEVVATSNTALPSHASSVQQQRQQQQQKPKQQKSQTQVDAWYCRRGQVQDGSDNQYAAGRDTDGMRDQGHMESDQYTAQHMLHKLQPSQQPHQSTSSSNSSSRNGLLHAQVAVCLLQNAASDATQVLTQEAAESCIVTLLQAAAFAAAHPSSVEAVSVEASGAGHGVQDVAQQLFGGTAAALKVLGSAWHQQLLVGCLTRLVDIGKQLIQSEADVSPQSNMMIDVDMMQQHSAIAQQQQQQQQHAWCSAAVLLLGMSQAQRATQQKPGVPGWVTNALVECIEQQQLLTVLCHQAAAAGLNHQQPRPQGTTPGSSGSATTAHDNVLLSQLAAHCLLALTDLGLLDKHRQQAHDLLQQHAWQLNAQAVPDTTTAEPWDQEYAEHAGLQIHSIGHLDGAGVSHSKQCHLQQLACLQDIDRVYVGLLRPQAMLVLRMQGPDDGIEHGLGCAVTQGNTWAGWQACSVQGPHGAPCGRPTWLTKMLSECHVTVDVVLQHLQASRDTEQQR